MPERLVAVDMIVVKSGWLGGLWVKVPNENPFVLNDAELQSLLKLAKRRNSKVQ